MATGLKFDTRQFRIKSELLKKISNKKKNAALEAVGAFVASEAKDRAPIDEGFLTADIETETYPKNDITVIRVPINAPSSQYAVKMHEDTYNLGPNSAAKQALMEKIVGQKYISRSIDEEKRAIKDIIKREMAL